MEKIIRPNFAIVNHNGDKLTLGSALKPFEEAGGWTSPYDIKLAAQLPNAEILEFPDQGTIYRDEAEEAETPGSA